MTDKELRTYVEHQHETRMKHYANLADHYAIRSGRLQNGTPLPTATGITPVSGGAAAAAVHPRVTARPSSWTTTKANGSLAFIGPYLNAQVGMTFGSENLFFSGNGLTLGLGATASLSGHITLNVDPRTLKGAKNIIFDAGGVGAGIAGFSITWYQNGTYIGGGTFLGVGIALPAGAGGIGTFS